MRVGDLDFDPGLVPAASRTWTSSSVPACWTPLATSSLTSRTASSTTSSGRPQARSAPRVNERAREGAVGSGARDARAVKSAPSATSYIAFGDRVT